MKLDQFRALCDREWKQQPRGDVVGLRLTGDSYDELYLDILTDGDPAWASAVEAAIELVNPVTRSAVAVAGGDEDIDIVEVQHTVPYGVLP